MASRAAVWPVRPDRWGVMQSLYQTFARPVVGTAAPHGDGVDAPPTMGVQELMEVRACHRRLFAAGGRIARVFRVDSAMFAISVLLLWLDAAGDVGWPGGSQPHACTGCGRVHGAPPLPPPPCAVHTVLAFCRHMTCWCMLYVVVVVVAVVVVWWWWWWWWW
jgi:hypothetical protein